MTRLLDGLERAQQNPEEEYHLTIGLRHLLSQLRDGAFDSPDEIEETLGDTSASPLFEAIYHHSCWVINDAYTDGAEPAIEKYQIAFELAQDRDWTGIGVLCLSELIGLLGDLNYQEESVEWLEAAISYLEAHYSAPDVHLGNVSKLITAIEDHQHLATDETLQRTIEYCSSRANHAKQRNRYQEERNFLEDTIELKNFIGEGVDAEENRLIEAFEAESEQKGQRSESLRASVLSTAISRCEGFAGDRKIAEWKRTVRESNRTAISEEMAEITHEPTEEEAEELEEALESLVDQYQTWITNYSPAFGFKLLLNQDAFLPNLELSREIAQDSIVSELITRTTISREGDTVAVRNPREDLGHRPANYSAMAQYVEGILGSLLYRLISRKILREHHFYALLVDADWLTADDHAFLTDLIIAFFMDRHAAALHLGVARLEGVIARTLDAEGDAITNFQGGESEQRTLGGLLHQMHEDVDENFVEYLNYRYVDPAGKNLRNRVSHGQVRYGVAGFHHTSICLFDIFRSMAAIQDGYR
jgi:hypothetical protein